MGAGHSEWRCQRTMQASGVFVYEQRRPQPVCHTCGVRRRHGNIVLYLETNMFISCRENFNHGRTLGPPGLACPRLEPTASHCRQPPMAYALGDPTSRGRPKGARLPSPLPKGARQTGTCSSERPPRHIKVLLVPPPVLILRHELQVVEEAVVPRRTSPPDGARLVVDMYVRLEVPPRSPVHGRVVEGDQPMQVYPLLPPPRSRKVEAQQPPPPMGLQL